MLCARLKSLMGKVALVQSLKGPRIIPLVESIKSRSCVTTKCVCGGLGVSLVVPLKSWGPTGGGDISWVWHWNGPHRTQMGPHYEPTNTHREQHCLMDTQVDKHWHDLALERWTGNPSPEISRPKICSYFVIFWRCSNMIFCLVWCVHRSGHSLTGFLCVRIMSSVVASADMLMHILVTSFTCFLDKQSRFDSSIITSLFIPWNCVISL